LYIISISSIYTKIVYICKPTSTSTRTSLNTYIRSAISSSATNCNTCICNTRRT
jgi:hypothetical protein